ncbi:hypothetical protein E5F05_07285 [Deinococcus metallilatus]|uniref:ArsR family transcriptional regulator n=1 Tax=Deinococcus metallilatus TaxID=1211322 RepID=A0AAJ5F270_9DEIO|nr:hypothetical protein [Deinococcus metallilatus]MBB5297080.1 hypothetical protein [Deinococcus metallilatus]QBY07773.1 hypothetical protein E5F05_07285 [Deinococcus metallilatus]RXJ13473.1 hypothetical protein ERJ73_06120 [Deinococcus metallilatus]TLK22370.1 hypothetical protein FCS05_17880 [Deinococcus metallilatus]GMA17332.1 hypothetical protein GCM10025871_36630 [Deinococcus metallilatus]
MPHTVLGSFGGEWFEVTTPEQARLLSDPAALRHLEPFIGRTLGAAEAAREAGVSVERMLYRVRQFVAAGLLEEAGERRRAGRPVRLYRAPGGFRVPFHLTPFADLEAQILRHGRPFDRLRARAGARGLARLDLNARLLYRSTEGEVHSETFMPDARTYAAFRQHHIGGDYMGVLWLDDGTARQVQEALNTLRELLVLQDGQRAGKRPYLIQTALHPLDADDPEALPGPPG